MNKQIIATDVNSSLIDDERIAHIASLLGVDRSVMAPKDALNTNDDMDSFISSIEGRAFIVDFLSVDPQIRTRIADMVKTYVHKNLQYFRS